jgi:thiamine-phosphate pyrophosphorylase
MPLDLKRPITYLVTNAKTTLQTTPETHEFSNVLKLIEAAVASSVSAIQLREKALSTRVLEDLAARAVELTRGSVTRLLINERFDVALACGADGVQLTSRAIPTEVVRNIVGTEFLIGVSTHSLDDVLQARDKGADFVLFGPVFETESKRAFGLPQGLSKLEMVTGELGAFPVIAIGGVNETNLAQCLGVGAAGIAGIGLFEDPLTFARVVELLQAKFTG